MTLAGCATAAEPTVPPERPPAPAGSMYDVRPGDTLWRIAHAFGLEPRQLAAVNGLTNPREVPVGRHLWIPLPPASGQFLWPALGEPNPALSRGVTITTSTGVLVRASRAGTVAVAAQHLTGWDSVVVLDHGDGYLSLYARLKQAFVAPGTWVAQGETVGQVGDRPLYFEIRYGIVAQDPLALLPLQS